MTGGALGAHPVTGARQLRDAWAWAVLPADAVRVAAGGGTLAHTLRDGGLQVERLDADGVDAVVFDAGDATPPPAFWERPGVPFVAAAVGGGPDVIRDRTPRLIRAGELLRENLAAPRVRARGRRLARTAAEHGREVDLLETSDRSRIHVLGPGGRRRPCAGFVLSAWSVRGRTGLDVALEAAAGDLEAVSVTVAESGKLIAVVVPREGGGPAAVARLGGGPAGELVERAAAATEYLGGPRAPDVVRRAMPEQLAAGRAGVMRYAVERWCDGDRPGSVDDALWRSCMDFLEGLRSMPAPARRAGSDVIAADVALLEPLLDGRSRVALEVVAALVESELEGVPLGWAHGDFWPDNLVVRGGLLDRVLDWDTADVDELPALDALDLIGFRSARMRWATLGTRLDAAILPSARGRDPLLVAHCEAVGAPTSAAGLEALAWAWWVRRAALQVRGNPDRVLLRTWRLDNLDRPLALAPTE